MHTRAGCLTIEDERAGVRPKDQIASLRQEYPDYYNVTRDLYDYNPEGWGMLIQALFDELQVKKTTAMISGMTQRAISAA